MHLHSIYSTNNWKGVKITENMQSTFVKYNIAKIYTFQLTKNAIIKQKLDFLFYFITASTTTIFHKYIVNKICTFKSMLW